MDRVLSLVVGSKERLNSEGKIQQKLGVNLSGSGLGFLKCHLIGSQAIKETGRTKCQATEERGDTPFSFWKGADTRNKALLGAFRNDSPLRGWSGSLTESLSRGASNLDCQYFSSLGWADEAC